MNSLRMNEKAVYAVFLLLLLSILDAFYTDLGLRNNFITEANPLMNAVYEKTTFGFYALKFLLPLIMLIIVMNIQARRHLWILINASLVLYALILAMHIRWILMVG